MLPKVLLHQSHPTSTVTCKQQQQCRSQPFLVNPSITSWGRRLTDPLPLELLKNIDQVQLGVGANRCKISGFPSRLAVPTLEGSETIPNLRHPTLQLCVRKASSSRYHRRVPTQTRNSRHGAGGGNGLLPPRRWRRSGAWHRPRSPPLPQRHQAGTADGCRCRKDTELESPRRFPMFLPKSQYFN